MTADGGCEDSGSLAGARTAGVGQKVKRNTQFTIKKLIHFVPLTQFLTHLLTFPKTLGELEV